MSMGGGGSIRTIWITLRAVNYASQAFAQISKDIGNLIGKEMELTNKQQLMIRQSLQYAQAGIMMATLSQQMAGSILNMAMSSRQGAGDMARLKQEIFLTNNALNNAAYEFLKSSGALALLNNILKEIQSNKGLQALIIGGIALVSVLTGLAAIIFITSSVMKVLTASSLLNSIALKIHALSVKTLGISFDTLKVAVAGALAGFMIFFTICMSLSGPARTAVSVIMLIVGALAVLIAMEAGASAGLTLIAAGAAIAGAASLTGQLTGAFANGTQSVQKTGPVFAHKGEVIYNPATNRPLQVGNDMARGSGSTTNMNTQITIENVHTKADYDDVAYQINKANRSGARSVR